MNIVCRLGEFHLLMSFFGDCRSEIENMLEELYASNVTQHILSGKAYARALRGHFLIHSSLLELIFEDMLLSGKLSH